MTKIQSALLLSALLALSFLPSRTHAKTAGSGDGKDDDSFNRADAVGCFADADYCGSNTGGSTCCINYHAPFCGTCEDYGACAPEGAIECMSDAAVPFALSAEELDVDGYIAAAPAAWEACLEKIASGGTIADCPRPDPSTASENESTSSSASNGISLASFVLGMAAIGAGYSMN